MKKCKICSRKEQCSFCSNKEEHSKMATLSINCEVEDYILGVTKKLDIKYNDTISYSMCMKCFKKIMEMNNEPE